MGYLSGIRSWGPFKIDALGIVTLLGADSLRKSSARLVTNPYSAYLPHLAAHIYADDSIAEAVPGFALYNITDGIKACDLSAWFTRWLGCQKLGWQETTLEIQVETSTGAQITATRSFGVGIAILVNAFLIAFPAALGDWYGLASCIGLAVTVLMRVFILDAYRRSLDAHTIKAAASLEPVKLFITLPNGRVVSVRTTRGITVHCLLTEARPSNVTLHRLARATDWVGFALHAVALGMASLATQIILVAVVLVSTIIEVQRFGADESRIGRHLRVFQTDDRAVNSRSKAYLKLDLDIDEEESMVKWDLFPQKSNVVWWQRYRTLQAGGEDHAMKQAQSQWYMA
ncbi:hypothetical protein NX059_007772 [Plenodomus lindquistii]|nr:hypothetical protein NX059_007772 [Plenodomus lindquistii]